MGSLKSGRKFDRESLELKIDSPKKIPMTFSCLPTTKLDLEAYSKVAHISTSEFINDIVEEAVTLYKNGGNIEAIKQAVHTKKLEIALSKAHKENEQLRQEKKAAEDQIAIQKVQLLELNKQITGLTQMSNNLSGELKETKEKILMDDLPKRVRDIFLEQVAYRIKEGKNKSALGVFIAMWLKALENSFSKSDKLNPRKEDRTYLESLIKE